MNGSECLPVCSHLLYEGNYKTLAKWLSGCGKDVSEYPVQFYEAPT